MAEELKKIATHTFTDGMNSTFSDEAIPATMARRMYNCHVLSKGSGNVGIVTNVKGNLRVQFTLTEGTNECIGSVVQEERNRFFIFIWNSNGRHTIWVYDSITKFVTKVIESITDTGGVDILRFSNLKQYRINMADVNLDNLYWVDGGLNTAKNLNVVRAMDKSINGYGPIILEEYINAYKQKPSQAPLIEYFSDPNVPVNRLYGSLRKFVYRFIYKGGEKSDYTDFSNVATPQKESFTGVNLIPTENNGMHISLQTGNREVEFIEVAMQTTLSANDSVSSWLLVAVISKDSIGIPDNSTYVFDFYNDGKYGVVDDVEKVVRPYSFLPDKPKVQALVRGAMVYGNFKQGWENFDLEVEHSVRYDPFNIDTGVINKMNSPQLIVELLAGSNITLGSGDTITKVDGTTVSNGSTAFTRNSGFKVTIGPDVKVGNTFSINFGNGNFQDQHNVSYTALATDTASSVATQLVSQLLAFLGSSSQQIVYRQAKNSPSLDIYARITGSDGSIGFQFNMGAITNAGYIINQGSSVNPISYQTLNDTGQSLKNMKLGDTRQWGFIYTDGDGRVSSTYTNDSLIIPIQSINMLNGYKKPVIVFNIYHQPPLWAKYWQLAVSDSMVYDNFIEMLIQKVSDVPKYGAGEFGEYLDLVVGSLFTYQKIHEGTTLRYEFKKGDRIRFIRDANEAYYPFAESEIISYTDTVTQVMNETATISNDDRVAVPAGSAIAGNVGKFIVIDGSEREIIEAVSSSSYKVISPIGTGTTPQVYTTYSIVDRRGVIRIRKPAFTITDNSMVEIYSPASKVNGVGAKQFFQLTPKYEVLYPGTTARAHGAPNFNQEVAIDQPGIIEVSQGNIYIRNREQPITNDLPAQSRIELVEDPSYSDFYESYMNDLGRVNVQDTGIGIVNFGSRLRFSGNYIEDTKINGLNDFNNLDRKDYYDEFGDIVLLKREGNRLLVFKELKDCWVLVYATLIQDKSGEQLVGTSNKLLGDLEYYGSDVGIGNDMESYAESESRQYHVGVNQGVIVRLSTDGITPISDIYGLDNEVRELLKVASLGGAKMIGGFDLKNGEYILHISATANNEATTLSFNEKEKKFITYYDYHPESMVKFKTDFFALKGGQLWEQNVNPIHNSFFGIKYPSRVIFVFNEDYRKNKLIFNLRLDSKGAWYSPIMQTTPSDQFPNGMKTRLKKKNFKLVSGKLWADILRDYSDPSFNNELLALFNGRKIECGTMTIELANNDDTEAKLSSVEVYYVEAERNF